MTILFEMLEKVGIYFFFPSMLFNESFWQTPYEKRLAILGSTQVEWVGSAPIQRSVFYRDIYFLELIKTVKLTYFSYTKLDLKGILEVFKTKNRFTVTDFSSFGDPKNSPIKFINDIFYKGIFNKLSKENLFRNDYGKLPRIAAVKFYSKFINKKEIVGLVLDLQNSYGYWEEFFHSLKLIDQKQNTNLLGKTKFYFTSAYNEVLDLFTENLKNFPTVFELYDKEQIVLEILDPSDFELKDKFDYIFSYFGINEIPSEILIKGGNNFYNALGRICYKKRDDEKKAIEKIADLQSPSLAENNIDQSDLFDIDYEIIWEDFENQNASELIEENYSLRERSHTRFSISLLSFFIKTVNSLKKDGYIELWNQSETAQNSETLGIYRTNEGKAYAITNINMYLSILNSFSDISIDYKLNNFSGFLSKEVLNNEGKVLLMDQALLFVSQNREIWEQLFSLENFKWSDELIKIEKSFKFYTFLKKKKILLLGLPTLLYNLGFKKFKNKILSNAKLLSSIEKDALKNNGLNSYSKEYLIASTTKLFQNMLLEKNIILIVKDKDSVHNKEFYEFIEKTDLNKDKIMDVILANWEVLSDFSDRNTNTEVLEISLK